MGIECARSVRDEPISPRDRAQANTRMHCIGDGADAIAQEPTR